MNIENKTAILLTQKNYTISVAESCTGGLLTHRLTNIPGSSKFFQYGIIAYSNEAKIKILKVPPQWLKQYGAVSQQVAIKMAQKVRMLIQSDFGIGITGIAGPEGGTKSKPVGLVYIAVSTKNEVLCLKCQFKGPRIPIKQKATTQALEILNEFLQ